MRVIRVWFEADVPVAFASHAPRFDPRMLRVTAALAVRHGMSLEAARAALTVRAAEVLDVADRVGRIAPGLDADLAVFTGDPVEPWARPLAVYIQGMRMSLPGTDEGACAKGGE